MDRVPNLDGHTVYVCAECPPRWHTADPADRGTWPAHQSDVPTLAYFSKKSGGAHYELWPSSRLYWWRAETGPEWNLVWMSTAALHRPATDDCE